MLPAPEDEEALRWLARAAHVRPDGSRDQLGVLREELKRHHMRVSRLHAKLFYQPLLESLAPEGLEFSQGMTPAAAERQLAALGYEAPQSALSHLSALINQTGRRGRVQAVLLPRLLDWLSDTPDPDGGLLAYRRISEAMVVHRWYLSTLRDKPAVAKRLMHVLGTSAYVPELLMRAPEVVQSYSDGASGPKLLEVDPARCVALEDSPNGVASATAAGCLVVAAPSFVAVPAAPRRLVVRSLSDVTLGTLRAFASANA